MWFSWPLSFGYETSRRQNIFIHSLRLYVIEEKKDTRQRMKTIESIFVFGFISQFYFSVEIIVSENVNYDLFFSMVFLMLNTFRAQEDICCWKKLNVNELNEEKWKHAIQGREMQANFCSIFKLVEKNYVDFHFNVVFPDFLNANKKKTPVNDHPFAVFRAFFTPTIRSNDAKCMHHFNKSRWFVRSIPKKNENKQKKSGERERNVNEWVH